MFVGLWLNITRVRYSWASMHLAGAAAATHNNPLDRIWGDALAPFEEEADEFQSAMNISRALARAMQSTRQK